MDNIKIGVRLFSTFLSIGLLVMLQPASSFAVNRVHNGQNIYSPFLLRQDGMLRMYFGGWMDYGQEHDAIYRSDCPWEIAACHNTIKVIDAVAVGLKQVNDPTIVRMPGGYYIMYMTGVLPGMDGAITENNKIYYSTSWDNDGVNWSPPQLLISGAWTPSATLNQNGEVILYANSNINGLVEIYNLGQSGVEVRGPVHMAVNTGFNYINVDVMYRPALNAYQMFGERVLENKSSVIDYLISWDGVNFYVGATDIVRPQPGQFRVNTPAPHPDSHGWVYYGETDQTNSMDFKINWSTWMH